MKKITITFSDDEILGVNSEWFDAAWEVVGLLLVALKHIVQAASKPGNEEKAITNITKEFKRLFDDR